MAIDRLAADDRMMVMMSARWPQEVAALALLDGRALFDADGRFRIEAVRDAIGSRLHLAPLFRQRIHEPRRGLGGPLWVDAPDFDIADHVHAMSLPAGAGEAELLVATERLRRRRLDPAHPLWEMWFLTGLEGRQVALFVRIHHAIADGMAAMATLAAFLDPAPDTPAPPAVPWTPRPVPAAPALLADKLGRLGGPIAGARSALAHPRRTIGQAARAWPAMRELIADPPGPVTSLDRWVGGDCSLALIRGSTGEVRDIAHTHDASMNDVLLTITAGGLRALLRSRGERVEGVSLPVYVPISLRRRLRGPQRGNRIAQMVVPLPVGVADPVARLRRISAETGARKARPRPSVMALFRLGIVRRWLLKAVNRQRINVTTANITGPRQPRYLAGARIVEIYPVLPLIAKVGLGVGVVSNAGVFGIGVTADLDTYPDLEVFVAAARDELRVLVSSTREAVTAAIA